ncbi:MAG: hypothetical protein N5P05_000072 [Chroococcopsis gigantea SAG 12.99]|jgi:hypothetical protein|nr:hypothetical protein [Chlorogloea purpurea SAG 13.99]MDV2998466.1 hypothetical protein [Chroococcopsis gigantea SAG 12.99]
MILLYRDIFTLICIGLLVWGFIRIERTYQYPFFMGSMFATFLLPQVYALVDNPGVVSQSALEKVLLMSCLCAAACWFGYQIPMDVKLLKKLNIIVDEKKLLQGGFVLMGIGYFFYYLLSRTVIQISESAGGTWTGPATIYYFFAQVLDIAFVIFILHLFKHFTFTNLIFAIAAGWMPFQAVLGGRRQPTMTFLVTIGMALWIVYRLAPPRWLLIGSVALGAVLLPLIGELRSKFWELLFSGQWDQILAVAQQTSEAVQKGDILELRNAALFIDVVERKSLYGLGANWWDAIVFQYVPGQIVGFDFKQSLEFRLVTNSTLLQFYGYSLPVGTTITGVGDSFMEFGYLGCLAFAALACGFKYLWYSSVHDKNVLSAVFYIALLSPSMVALTHGIGRFWQEIIIKAIIVYILALYSGTSKFSKSSTNTI